MKSGPELVQADQAGKGRALWHHKCRVQNDDSKHPVRGSVRGRRFSRVQSEWLHASLENHGGCTQTHGEAMSTFC